MSNSEVSYNGYTFGSQSHVSISAEMQEDDAGRTIVYHRYKIRVQGTILAEPGDSYVGQHFRRIRQLLSKAGARLVIDHEGFGPRLAINGGPATSGVSGVSDVAFGPKPKLIAWYPVGATNAVEVIWECEFCLPTCEGLGGVRFTGLAALNYSVSYKIDKMGYTTRTIAGYLEIAMTRVGYSIPDTADAYREVIQAPKPENFERETTWQISLDKRRADFSITDAEIQSPNAYPPGVVKIRANHRVGFSRRNAAVLPNTISAVVSLAPNQPRGRAWEIFRSIVAQRVAYATGGKRPFFEGMEVDEELFENSVAFNLSYRIYAAPNTPILPEFFSATGLFSDLAGTWQDWSASMGNIQTHRGVANLQLSPTDDQIVDLCTDSLLPSIPQPYIPTTPAPTTYQRFCNEKPPPYESWLRFEGALTSIEEHPAVEQITVGQDDLRARDFDPTDPYGTQGETDQTKRIQRYIESAPAGMEFEWIGYAERVGYDIPRPNRLKFGNVTLVRRGKQVFRKKPLGLFFCQPLYGAAWRMRYVVDTRPESVDTNDADPINAESES